MAAWHDSNRVLCAVVWYPAGWWQRRVLFPVISSALFGGWWIGQCKRPPVVLHAAPDELKMIVSPAQRADEGAAEMVNTLVVTMAVTVTPALWARFPSAE